MENKLDAIIVGAGFSGIYACKKLSDQNLNVKLLEAGADVGGTWFWNRYPGATSDSWSAYYRYSWDLDDLKAYPWPRAYVRQPEVLAYLRHVVERHNLRRFMQFNTQMTAAHWDDGQHVWRVKTAAGDTLSARYLITAMGLLSKRSYPNLPGLDQFKGKLYHTAAWPETCDLKGKRIAIFGNGSTGTQLIKAVAEEAGQLVCFQRSPQYVVPSGDREISAEERQKINDSYEKLWADAKGTTWAIGVKESTVPTMSVSAEEREKIFEDAWNHGNGFHFMFGTFSDLAFNEEANRQATDFIKRKIRSIVKDPVKAERLIPNEFYARRPPCTNGYYDTFNRDHVDIVNLKQTPITKITDNSIITSDGEYPVDVILCATGFDGMDGTYSRVHVTGRSGETLTQHWAQRTKSYLGISVADFPNLLMVTGPFSPFTNNPPLVETQVDFISDIIARARSSLESVPVVEATPSAEEEWTDLCDGISSQTLFARTPSWITGNNVAGKRSVVQLYVAGLTNYRKALEDVVQNDYRGYKTF